MPEIFALQKVKGSQPPRRDRFEVSSTGYTVRSCPKGGKKINNKGLQEYSRHLVEAIKITKEILELAWRERLFCSQVF